ncbi:cupin domain-containing protein [Candidatus Latescibacterota bacterium]
MVENIYSGIPDDLPNELTDIIASNENIRIERIISRGNATPPGEWYDQDENEYVLLLSGMAKLSFENSPDMIDMKAGDYLIIPAHKRHRVEWTTPDKDTVWLAVFY